MRLWTARLAAGVLALGLLATACTEDDGAAEATDTTLAATTAPPADTTAAGADTTAAGADTTAADADTTAAADTTSLGRHPNDRSFSFYFRNPSGWHVE